LTPSARSRNLTAGYQTKNGLPRFEQRTGTIDLKELRAIDPPCGYGGD
jgi:hypothetical protein